MALQMMMVPLGQFILVQSLVYMWMETELYSEVPLTGTEHTLQNASEKWAEYQLPSAFGIAQCSKLNSVS